MASRKGNPVHGWVILDKPLNITSTRAVGIVRRVFRAAKAGHGGTLDPLATGILPIALGEATKTVSFAMNGTKSYEFTLRFGSQTTTDDAEGDVVLTSTHRPDETTLQALVPQFSGSIMQRPPIFSAIKVDGMRAYDLARQAVGAGAEVLPELAPRPIVIDSLEFRGMDGEDARFVVSCGKGTYIRSLARDIAAAAGSAGHVSHLRRLSVGPFTENDAISLAFLEKLEHSSAAFEHLKPVMSALADIPALPISAGEAATLRHGQTLSALGPSAEERFANIMSADVGVATAGGVPVALVTVKAGQLQPLRVFNL